MATVEERSVQSYSGSANVHSSTDDGSRNLLFLANKAEGRVVVLRFDAVGTLTELSSIQLPNPGMFY